MSPVPCSAPWRSSPSPSSPWHCCCFRSPLASSSSPKAFDSCDARASPRQLPVAGAGRAYLLRPVGIPGHRRERAQRRRQLGVRRAFRMHVLLRRPARHLLPLLRAQSHPFRQSEEHRTDCRARFRALRRDGPPLLQKRIAKGIEIQRQDPHARLILSGGQAQAKTFPKAWQ